MTARGGLVLVPSRAFTRLPSHAESAWVAKVAEPLPIPAEPPVRASLELHGGAWEAAHRPSVQQRSEEWTQARRAIVGASEAAAVLGKGLWSSRDEVMRRKLTGEATADNFAMARGRDLEPVALRHYAAAFNDVVLDQGLVLHSEFPFIGASPDGFSGLDGHGIEMKCPRE